MDREQVFKTLIQAGVDPALALDTADHYEVVQKEVKTREKVRKAEEANNQKLMEERFKDGDEKARSVLASKPKVIRFRDDDCCDEEWCRKVRFGEAELFPYEFSSTEQLRKKAESVAVEAVAGVLDLTDRCPDGKWVDRIRERWPDEIKRATRRIMKRMGQLRLKKALEELSNPAIVHVSKERMLERVAMAWDEEVAKSVQET